MQNHDKIIIEGAKENNLKNINIEIPKDKLVVITGVSGSGKSSLAFDTIYAEGYRRYVENLSSYARFFLESIRKPKIKRIENLAPAIAIEQKNSSQNPRSTVGTITGIYDFLRHLYAHVGVPYCPTCGLEMKKQGLDAIVEKVRKFSTGTQLAILGNWPEKEKPLLESLTLIEKQGYARVRIGEFTRTILEAKHDEEVVAQSHSENLFVVVDRMQVNQKHFDRERLIDSLQTAAKISKGQALILVDNSQKIFFNKYFICPECYYTIKNIAAKNFSFNSPEGACDRCSGLGKVAQVDPARVIPNHNLSLAEGAIMPWNKTGRKFNGENFYQQILEAFAKKYRISLHTPLNKVPASVVEKLLQGTKDEELEIKDKGLKRKMKFEGVIKYLEDKYQKADSTFARNEIEKYMIVKDCPICQGKRLKKQFLQVKVFNKSIDELVKMEVRLLVDYGRELLQKIKKEDQKEQGQVEKQKIIVAILEEINNRLQPIVEVGLGYLDLDRSCQTLSGGEFQRTRLATQLYSGLSGVIYVLDEPSVGLHSRDNRQLIKTIRKIKDKGNSVIVVEHDRDIIIEAEHLIDMGPGAGKEGGEVTFQGTIQELETTKSETSLYLFNKKKFSSRKDSKPVKDKLTIKGATENNLKDIDVEIPLKKMVAVAGVSGSGKSSLINDILAKSLRQQIMGSFDQPGKHKKIEGLDKISKVVIVDQTPLGRSPRSNAATYTGVFSYIRELFARTDLAKEKGYNASHFSFNMRGGRCEYCQGEGTKKIEMHLLDDVYATCAHCQGTRYSKKILDVQYHGVNIAGVLDMSIEYAFHFFSSHRVITEKLEALNNVGLGYLKLGQNALELSGGEAQRIKLAAELARKSSGSSLYLLDEPTVGLHFSDIARLLKVLQSLVDKGNSVIVVEHNVDVIKASDWVIELGPEGGKEGGYLVFQGKPEALKKAKTWTGKALAGKL